MRVAQLPDPARVTVTCDGQDFTRWRQLDTGRIELDVEVADHVYRIHTGRVDAVPPPAGDPAQATAEQPIRPPQPTPITPPLPGARAHCC